MLAADLEDLCADVALDQAENVGVGAALDLAHQPLLVRVQELQALDLGQSIGQEFLRDVEFASANDVAIDFPTDALGYLDGLGVTVTCSRVLHGFHDLL